MYAQANQNWTSKTKQGFWLTLLAESLHQRSTAKSAEKLLRVGYSVLTSSKSLRVEQLCSSLILDDLQSRKEMLDFFFCLFVFFCFFFFFFVCFFYFLFLAS